MTTSTFPVPGWARHIRPAALRQNSVGTPGPRTRCARLTFGEVASGILEGVVVKLVSWFMETPKAGHRARCSVPGLVPLWPRTSQEH